MLDVPGGSTLNGTPIQEWTANGFLQQEWQITAVGGGYYSILNTRTTKALEVTGGSTADGGQIDQSDFTAADNQLWQIYIPPNDADADVHLYVIVNKKSGKVLDDTGFSLANGTLIQQWDYLGGANQQWYIELASN